MQGGSEVEEAVAGNGTGKSSKRGGSRTAVLARPAASVSSSMGSMDSADGRR